ncbi:MAG: ParB/RepB/Spo0J family partition protein [Gemmatimonadota bacterium]
MTQPRKERLGRGLSALLGEAAVTKPAEAPSDPAQPARNADTQRVPLTDIRPNPLQPRREFSEAEIEDLARSLDENGLLQPLLVRPRPDGHGYELVAGERRFRAATRLGWTDIPVLVRDVDEQELLVLALVENLQREGLTPLEEAEGYRALQDQFGLTHLEISKAVGKDRSTVTNSLRLLNLPATVRRLLTEGALSAGHARALLAVDDPVRAAEVARRAVAEQWSVREVERQVQKQPKPRPASNGRSAPDPHLAALERALEEALSTRVQLARQKNGAGAIEIPFHNDEEFERLFALITGRETTDVLG